MCVNGEFMKVQCLTSLLCVPSDGHCQNFNVLLRSFGATEGQEATNFLLRKKSLILVGGTGLEPVTSSMSMKRSNQLS